MKKLTNFLTAFGIMAVVVLGVGYGVRLVYRWGAGNWGAFMAQNPFVFSTVQKPVVTAGPQTADDIIADLITRPENSNLTQEEIDRTPLLIQSAIDQLQTQVKDDPEDFGAWYKMGTVYTISAKLGVAGSDEWAKTAFEKALAIYPNSGEASGMLGLTLARLGERENAREYLQKAMVLLAPGSAMIPDVEKALQ